jgi:hypothetical protein
MTTIARAKGAKTTAPITKASQRKGKSAPALGEEVPRRGKS